MKSIPRLAAITQPSFAPWNGLFEMIDRADVFVFLDDVQYPRKEWAHRNRIRSPRKEGWEWISVSVRRGGSLEQLICETELNYESPWIANMLDRLELAYGQLPTWETLGTEFGALLERRYPSIGHLNMAIIEWGVRCLGIETELRRSSDLDVPGRREEKLVGLLEAVDSRAYLANNGSAVYIDESKFLESGIWFGFQNYEAPAYAGYEPERLPPLSFLDTLLVEGRERALQIIRSGRPAAWMETMKVAVPK